MYPLIQNMFNSYQLVEMCDFMFVCVCVYVLVRLYFESAQTQRRKIGFYDREVSRSAVLMLSISAERERN